MTHEVHVRMRPDWVDINWIRWATNERLLFSKSEPATYKFKGHLWNFTRDRIVSTTDKPLEYINLFDNTDIIFADKNYKSSLVDILASDPEHILIPEYYKSEIWLVKVNFNSGEKHFIAKGGKNTYAWYIDKSGSPTLRLDINTNGTKLTSYSTQDGGQTWTKLRKTDLNENGIARGFEIVKSGPEPNLFYVRDYKEGDEFKSILLYDSATDQIIDTIFSRPDADIGRLIVSLESEELLGATYFSEKFGIEFKYQNHADEYNKIRNKFGSHNNVLITQYAKESDWVVIYRFSDKISGQYFAYNTQTEEKIGIAEDNPFIRDYVLGKSELIHFPARDGVQIPAIVTHPAGITSLSKAPLIIMPHGGPEARDIFTFDPIVQYFATRGYRIIQPQFRGSEGYGRSFVQAGYGEWGGLMQDDIMDSAQWLFDQGVASPDTTCIFGASFGGYSALHAATNNPDMISCAISNVGVTDLQAFLKYKKKRYGADSSVYQYWTKSIGHPRNEMSKISQHSPINKAQDLKVPVLLINALKDTNVPPEQSIEYYNRAQKHGKDIQYVPFEDEGHSGWSPENEILHLQHVENFLHQHIGQ